LSKHIAVIGGGYTGASVAIQLSQQAREAHTILVVEPRKAVGAGLAYSTTDPDHRLNAPDMVHFVTPDDQKQLSRWYEEQGGAAFDAEAETDDGALFVRRGDFGRFLSEQFSAHQTANPSNSTIHHIRDRALDIVKQGSSFHVSLESGESLDADIVVVGTSNEKPSIPTPFASTVADHPAFIADPANLAAVEAIPNDAPLLFIGTGLTAADLIVTRLRLGHRGPVTALSRRGLQPTRRATSVSTFSGAFWDRFVRETSIFVAKHGRHHRLRDVMKALRADIRDAEARGEPWQAAFDDLRDSVWQVWPALPVAEKRRFMRHLRVWYDVHRFRLPPQIEAKLDIAVGRGQLRYKAASILSATANGSDITVEYRDRFSNAVHTKNFGAVINCTGPEPRPDRTENPFMQALISRGLARVHPVGTGFDVDGTCAVIDAGGERDPRLRMFGPLTIGQFGDPQGAPFILSHICKQMPEIVKILEDN
jgi:uncharacterized NAD(P)/FAD-binding protein YdhS